MGVAQWIECGPGNRKVAGLIPSQGTHLGCGPGPQLEACKRQPVDISLPLSPSLLLSLKINKTLKKYLCRGGITFSWSISIIRRNGN